MNNNELNTTPVTPSEGAADPLTVPEPATPTPDSLTTLAAEIGCDVAGTAEGELQREVEDAELAAELERHAPAEMNLDVTTWDYEPINPPEKNSQDCPEVSCEVGSNEPSLTPEQVQESFDKLHKDAYDKAEELGNDYQTLMRRFDCELLPLVDRMQSFLSQRGSLPMRRIVPSLPSWADWRDAFLSKLEIKMSVSTLKRKLKELRDWEDRGGEPEETGPEDGEGDGDGGEGDDDPPSPPVETPKQAVSNWMEKQRKVLSNGADPADADPLRSGERRIDTAIQQLDELELSVNEGLLDGLEPAEPQKRCICNRQPDDEPLALSRLVQILKDVAVELCRAPYHLGGFAADIDTIVERIEDRMELDKRMDKLAERLTKRPKGWKPNEDMLFLQLRRDRRFIQDMKNILKAGGTTYRGQKIWGKDDEVFIFRYTREDITLEMDTRETLGGPVNDPKSDERLGHVEGDGHIRWWEDPPIPQAQSVFNPILTKLPVPEPSTSEDPFAVLIQSAFVAAAKAVNDVSETDIKPRYASKIHFYTGRKTMKLRKWLDEHKAEFNLKGGFYKGKNCYWIETFVYDKNQKKVFNTPVFKTQEEADAYERGFRSALPAEVDWGEPPSSGNPG